MFVLSGKNLYLSILNSEGFHHGLRRSYYVSSVSQGGEPCFTCFSCRRLVLSTFLDLKRPQIMPVLEPTDCPAEILEVADIRIRLQVLAVIRVFAIGSISGLLKSKVVTPKIPIRRQHRPTDEEVVVSTQYV
jgi:hypothetical protein